MSRITIVGGSSGIGLALVQRLIDKNEVVNISRTPCPVAGVTNITADATDPSALDAAFKKIAETDALVYCAGTSMAAAVEHAPTDAYRRIFEVNILGAIECVRLALPMLNRSDDGRIILLSSAGAVTPIPFDSFYSATKAAMNAFSRALMLEQSKVKCTAAVIGGTRTRFSFKREVYGADGANENLTRATDALINIEQSGYTADFVASKLLKLLHAQNPPPVVTVGLKNKLMLATYKLLPYKVQRMILKLVYKLNY